MVDDGYISLRAQGMGNCLFCAILILLTGSEKAADQLQLISNMDLISLQEIDTRQKLGSICYGC